MNFEQARDTGVSTPKKEFGAASRCNCPGRARCQFHSCDQPADWSIYQPSWPPRPASYIFMCDPHLRIYVDAWTKPMKGIDRPEHADDEWRGSILEHVRHAKIAIDFADRDKHTKIDDEQASQMETWRRGVRHLRQQTSGSRR